MKKPGMATLSCTKKITDKEEVLYCKHVNDLIRKLSFTKGEEFKANNFYGNSYRYQDENVRCVYQDSDYGNEIYHLAISTHLWKEIPCYIDLESVCADGYICVYGFQDSPDRQILLQHIEGTWFEILKKLYKQK